jgi:hypothetical protein
MDKIETRFKCDKIYIQFGTVLAQNIMSCLSETAEGGGGGWGVGVNSPVLLKKATIGRWHEMWEITGYTGGAMI